MRLATKIISTCALLLLTLFCAAQDSTANQILLRLHYGVDLAGGDLADRFGSNFRWGGQISILSSSNLSIGIGYDFLFGSTVDEDVLAPLRTPEGFIIGRDMAFASVFLRERGSHLYATVGYFLGKTTTRARRGLQFGLGLGYLQHRIRFVDDFDSVVQIAGDLAKGYDRLTGGPAISEHLGYIFLGRDRLLNFYVGLQFIQGFTKSLRGFNYDIGLTDTASRVDQLFGAQISWIIPIGTNQRTIYY